MTYRVELSRSADKALQVLPSSDERRLRRAIDALAINPRPQGAIKLAGETDHYRIRVGNYRVIYSIVDERLLVLVLKAGQRGGIYR